MNNAPTINTQPNLPNYFQNVGDSPSSLFGQLFSSAFDTMKWFVGLRWYVILFIVIFGSYLFFQMEYAVESRRINREINREDTKKEDANKEGANKEGAKKEGMEEYKVDKMKGILRQNNGESIKKHVSFHNEDPTKKVPSQIYNLWIRPWIYVLFRNVGIRSVPP